MMGQLPPLSGSYFEDSSQRRWVIICLLYYLHSLPFQFDFQKWEWNSTFLQMKSKSLDSKSLVCSFDMPTCSSSSSSFFFFLIYSAWLCPCFYMLGFFFLSVLYAPKFRVPTKFIYWSPNPQSGGIKCWVFWKLIRAWRWRPRKRNQCPYERGLR